MRKLALVAFVVLFAMAQVPAAASAMSQNQPEAKKASTATPPEPKFKIGDIAPDFTLKDQSGKDVSLHDFRGKKNVVLAFYIFAFSGG